MLLGEGIEVKEKEEVGKPNVVDASTFRNRNMELWKARQAHDAGEGPKPEPRPTDTRIFGVIDSAAG